MLVGAFGKLACFSVSIKELLVVQDICLQAALQTSAEALEARKRMMDDSALEADHRTDGPPPLKSPMKVNSKISTLSA